MTGATDEPPRVLMLHNRYRSGMPSGENVSVRQELDVLRAAGWDVALVETDSDDLVDASRSLATRLRAAPRAAWNPLVVEMIDDAVARHRPDVVHVQNDFPLLGPAVHHHLHQAGIPCVQSIRNYRFACVSASFHRDGSDCFSCLGLRAPLPGVGHRCGGSVARSAYVATWIVATAAMRSRGRPLMLANSRYVADLLLAHGIDPQLVRHRHNLGGSRPESLLPREGRSGVVVAGRLDAAKGIVDFMREWAAGPPSGHVLSIFGDGPQRADVQELANREPSIEFRGRVDHAAVLGAMARARLVVTPSRWPEPFGRVALEAMQHGTPALVTAMGGLPEIVAPITPELVVAPDGLMARLRWALQANSLPSPRELADHAEIHFGVDVFVDRTRRAYLHAIRTYDLLRGQT